MIPSRDSIPVRFGPDTAHRAPIDLGGVCTRIDIRRVVGASQALLLRRRSREAALRQQPSLTKSSHHFPRALRSAGDWTPTGVTDPRALGRGAASCGDAPADGERNGEAASALASLKAGGGAQDARAA